ncbi:hypothetical protein BgiMline_010424, partial [Biomphalaria glabrata]
LQRISSNAVSKHFSCASGLTATTLTDSEAVPLPPPPLSVQTDQWLMDETESLTPSVSPEPPS